MISRVRLWIVLCMMLPLTVLLMPVQFIALKLGLGFSRLLPKWWHRVLLYLVGVKVAVKGDISHSRPLMFVANHISWSDIIVLGSVAEVCFVAKREVAETPFAGLLAHLQRTIFVKREERRNSGKQAREISQRLLDGDAIVLFPEGTTGDGERVLEFKSSLFGAAKFALDHEDIEEITIQPVSISYTRLHGMPLGRAARSKAAWPGDIALAPHAVEFMRASAWDVTVSFAEPLTYDGSQRRHVIARETKKAIRKMYTEAVHGRTCNAD